MRIRNLKEDDYDKKYHELLSILTHQPESQTREDFILFVAGLSENHQVLVIEDVETHRIVATITLLFEKKAIHGGSKILHVEDVIVHPQSQKSGLGRKLMEKAVQTAREMGCYKIILDCILENVGFYTANGFHQKQVQMSLYLPSHDTK